MDDQSLVPMTNSQTGETKMVKPSELGQYGVDPNEFNSYIKSQSGQSIGGQNTQPIGGSTPVPPPQPGFLDTFIKNTIKPFVGTAKDIGAGGVEATKMIGVNTANDVSKNIINRTQDISHQLMTEKDPAKKQALLDESRQLSNQLDALGQYAQNTAQSGNQFMTDKEREDLRAHPFKHLAKNELQVASYAIPFGKGGTLATKALLPGAATGMIGALGQDEVTPESVIKSGLLGAGVAGATQLGSDALGWVGNKIMGKTKDLAEGGGSALRQGINNPQVSPADVNGAVKQKDISNTLNELGLTGSAAAKREQLPVVMGDISNQIQEKLAANPTTMALKDVGNTIQNNVESAINFGENKSAFQSAQESILNQLKKVSDDGQTISNTGLVQYKQKLGDMLKPAFSKLEKGNPLTSSEEAYMTAWNSLDDIISAVNPEVKDLTTKQSMLFKAAPGLYKSANQPAKALGLIPLPIPNRLTQSTGDLAGRVLQGLGNKIPEQLPNLGVTQMLQQIGARAPAYGQSPTPGASDQSIAQPAQAQDMTGQGQNDQNQPQISNTQNQGLQNQNNGQNNTQGQSTNPYDSLSTGQSMTREQAAQAMIRDAFLTGGKNQGLIQMMYKLSNPQAALTGANQQGLSQIQQAESTISQLENDIGDVKTGPLGIGGVGPFGGQFTEHTKFNNPNAAAYDTTREAAARIVGRAIAPDPNKVTEDDIQRAKNLLPSITENKDTNERRLQSLKQLIASKKQALLTPGLSAPLLGGQAVDTSNLDVTNLLNDY